MALPKKLKNRRMLTKNTPRVLFGKQEGWVLELYTPPPQPDHADPDKKHQREKEEKEREKAHKKEEKKREKAEKERAKAKEKEEKERLKIERKRGSTIACDPLPVAAGSNRDNGFKDDQHSRDRSESEGDASHVPSAREDDNHASKRDKKKGKSKEKSNGTHDLQHHSNRTEPIRVGHEHENGHHARDEESKDHPERVVIHSTDSEGEHHDFTIDDMGEWFDVEGTEMANWEKLELAARAPQQMMAWKQFFTLGETDDGVRERFNSLCV
jgi:hypothetical protein